MCHMRLHQPFLLRLVTWVACMFLCFPAEALDPKRPLIQLHHTAWNETSGISGSVYKMVQTTDGFL
jgi:hypothetical protein